MTLFWSLFKGSALGLVLGGFGIILLTLAVPRHVGTAPPQTPLTEGPVTAEDIAPEAATEIEVAGSDTSPTAPEVPNSPATSDAVAALVADTDTLALPEVELQSPTPDAPLEIANLPTETTLDSPVFPNPQSLAPQPPVNERDIVVSTEPATAPEPVVIEDAVNEEPVEQVVVVEENESATKPEDSPIAADIAVAPSNPPAEIEVETESPELPVTTEVATSDAPTLGTTDETEVSPQIANSLEAPSGISPSNATEGEPVEVAVAAPLETSPADQTAPDPLLAQESTLNPSAANVLETPQAVASAVIENETVDVVLAQIDGVAVAPSADVLNDVADLGEVNIAEDALVQPDVPIATETTPTIAELDQTSTPVAPTAQPADVVPAQSSEIEVPDDTVVAALPSGSEITLSAVPVPAQPVQEAETTAATPPIVRSIFERSDTPSTLPQGAGGVRVNRFGSATPEEEAPATEEPVETEGDVGSLERFATSFSATEGTSLMSVALYDDNSNQDAIDLLSDSGLAITVVLDAAQTDANEKMTAYRDAGLEVAMTVSLPLGATTSDAAIALEAATSNVSQAVAYIDIAGIAASSRDFAAQFALAIAEDGLGLILPNAGLNPGLAEAATQNVPAALIDRDLSSAQQDPRVLGRFLDQAAFQSRQDGSIVLLGRLNAETIEALQNFAQSQRGAQISLAPVSAALLSN